MNSVAKQRIFYLGGYSGKSITHGGVHRSNQIKAAILSNFGDITEIVDIRSYKKVDLLLSVIFFPVVLFRLHTYPITVSGWFKACVIFKTIRNYLRGNNNCIFFIEGWDDLYLIAGLLIRESQKRYITFPQNIDGMRQGLVSRCFRSLWGRFSAEIALYRGALQNMAICDFDQAIIESFSSNATVFPFYPVEKKLNSLRLIKSARIHVASNDVLLLGTAGNPPTRIAIEAFLQKATATNFGRFKITVAGFGCEVFSAFNSKDITILGSLSEERLNQLLVHVHCILIPVFQTTGFLTKLVDMNLAGIPVVLVGHYLQAINLENYGIYFSNTLTDLPNILKSIQPPIKEFIDPQLKDVLKETVAGEW